MKVRLPLPFLILILAGIVSVCSLVVSWRSGAEAPSRNTVQVESVEQERMAALYLRVLGWMSGVKPAKTAPELPRTRLQPFQGAIAKTTFLRPS